MKTLIQVTFAAILMCVWAVPPHAQAQVAPAAEAAAGMLRAAFTVGKKGEPFIISLVDKQGKTVTQFLTKPAEDLSQFLPSRMSADLRAEAAKALKGHGKFSFGKMALSKLKRFPAESLGFFISLGALVFYDMWQKAAHNPVAFEQLIHSQLDPIGQIAFYAFMLANGAVSEPFMLMIRDGKLNPRLAPFITYSGMGVGMMASNIVHELASWPGLAQCAGSVWIPDAIEGATGGAVVINSVMEKNLKACDQAAAAWKDRGGLSGLSHEWAPGLISLIGSTLLASAVQGVGKVILTQSMRGVTAAVSYSGRWALGKAVQMTAVEIALVFTPGGFFIKTIRVVTGLAGFYTQLTLFNAIQHAIERPVTLAWGNYFKSGKLNELDQKIILDLKQVKNLDWNDEATKDLTKDVEAISHVMKTWRQMNLTEVLETQANWEQKIGYLTKAYSITDTVYSDFVGRIWQTKFGPYKDAYQKGEATSLFNRTFPLNGINVAPAADPNAKDETTWLEAPDQIEQRQIVTIQNAIKTFKPDGLNQNELADFKKIVNRLNTTETMALGRGLEQLNFQLKLSNRKTYYTSLMTISQNVEKELVRFRRTLGNPFPIWDHGLGYIVALANTPSNKPILENSPYPVESPSFAKWLFSGMMYGPDLENGGKAVDTRSGFKDIFKPPRIRLEDNWRPKVQESNGTMPEWNVFNTGVFDHLAEGNIRPSVLNADPQSFRNWWKKYPETEYLKAWLDYERLYQKNMTTLVKSFTNKDMSKFNRGTMANGVLPSFMQEFRFYTMILGEMLKDSYVLRKKEVPAQMWAPNPYLIGTNLKNEQKDAPVGDFNILKNPLLLLKFPLVMAKQAQYEAMHVDGPRLLPYLAANKSMDFGTYMSLQKQNLNPTYNFTELRNLTWQEKLLTRLEELQAMISAVKVKEIRTTVGTSEEMPVSTLNTKDYKEKSDNLIKFLDEIESLLFLGPSDLTAGNVKKDPGLLSPDRLILVNEEQRTLAKTAFLALRTSILEMTALVDAVNTASYVERHNQQGHTTKRCVETPQQGLGGVQKVQQAVIEGC